MRWLIGCERSGRVREAFRAAGHDAYSCDLAPADDRSPYHIQADVLDVVRREAWHGLIVHPPCTYLCNSGVGRLAHAPKNPGAGVLYGRARWDAMNAAAELVAALWHCRIARVAIENPIMHRHAREAIQMAGMIGRVHSRPRFIDWPAPAQTIQPYQFGDDASKRTALWLRGLPALQTPHESSWAAPRVVCTACGAIGRPPLYHDGCDCPATAKRRRWSNQTDSGQNKLTPSADRGQLRSETYPGIAAAMAAQWGKL
jgi:hypothetical protein